MGFSLRKSIKLGKGTRLNLSSKGIGISTGIKGLRVSSRGRIYGGTGIFRFQKSIGGTGRHSGSRNQDNRAQGIPAVSSPYNKVGCLAPVLGFLGLVFMLSGTGFGYFMAIVIGLGFAGLAFFSKEQNDGYIIYLKEMAEGNEPSSEELKKAFNLYKNIRIELALALTLVEEKNWEEARDYFYDIDKKTNRTTILVTGMLGVCLLNLGEMEEAKNIFLQMDSIKDDVGLMEVLAKKAEAFFNLKQYDKAIAVVRTGLAKRSEKYVEGQRELRLWLARIFSATGESGKAKAEIKKVLNEVPDFEAAKDLLGEIDGVKPINQIQPEKGADFEASSSLLVSENPKLQCEQEEPEEIFGENEPEKNYQMIFLVVGFVLVFVLIGLVLYNVTGKPVK